MRYNWEMTRSGDAEKIVFDFVGNCPVDSLDSIKNWSPQCFQFLLSKFLSSAILLGSVAVKLPQVFNIVSTKNVVGLSPQAFYSEVPLATLSVLYSYRLGYAFTSYGESVMVLIQNMILVYLLWVYMQPKPSTTHKLSVLAVFVAVGVIAYHLPAEYLYVLPNINLALMMYARVAQIVNNFRQGTTGQLSSITTGLTFIGSVARIFTTMTEAGGDILLLASFGISTALSGTLLFQVPPCSSFPSRRVAAVACCDRVVCRRSFTTTPEPPRPRKTIKCAWNMESRFSPLSLCCLPPSPLDAVGRAAAVGDAKGSSLNLLILRPIATHSSIIQSRPPPSLAASRSSMRRTHTDTNAVEAGGRRTGGANQETRRHGRRKTMRNKEMRQTQAQGAADQDRDTSTHAAGNVLMIRRDRLSLRRLSLPARRAACAGGGANGRQTSGPPNRLATRRQSTVHREAGDKQHQTKQNKTKQQKTKNEQRKTFEPREARAARGQNESKSVERTAETMKTGRRTGHSWCWAAEHLLGHSALLQR